MREFVKCLLLVLMVTEIVASENQRTDIKNSVKSLDKTTGVKLVIENVLPEELNMKPVERIKKSFYSQHPCASCGISQTQYAQQPNPVYSQPVYNNQNYQQTDLSSASSDTSPFNFYAQPQMSSKIVVGCQPHVSSVPDVAYLPHLFNSPLYNQPSYSQSTYSQPAHSQQSYSQPAYNQKTYSRPAFSQQGYSQPPYNQPASAFTQTVYGQPTRTQQPYNPLAYNQPLNNPLAYNQPFNNQLAYNQPRHSQSIYSQPPYSQPHSLTPPKSQNVLHRSHEDSSASSTKNSDLNNKENMPEKFDLLNNSQPKGNTIQTNDNLVSQPTPARTENSDASKPIEEAKMKQPDTLYKMAKYQSQLANMVVKEDLRAV
ncbi:hypothetical protein Bhyg_05934, partial [Pseudolycoriella hygida]